MPATEAQKGQNLYVPFVAGFPIGWNFWKVVKVTKNTFTIRYGQPGVYINKDATFSKLRKDGTPNHICVLYEND